MMEESQQEDVKTRTFKRYGNILIDSGRSKVNRYFDNVNFKSIQNSDGKRKNKPASLLDW